MDIPMRKSLTKRFLFWLLLLGQGFGALATEEGKKDDKPRSSVVHPIVLPKGIGQASVAAPQAVRLLKDQQLSTALDKAVAQLGETMALSNPEEFFA
jgi:hypothetical protein